MEGFVSNEERRRNWGTWLFIAGVIIGFILYNNFKSADVLLTVCISLITLNTATLLVLIVKNNQQRLAKLNENYIKGLQKKINESIRKELSTSFNKYEARYEEYTKRDVLYGNLSAREKFSLIKIILYSLFFALAYTITYVLFNDSIIAAVNIFGLNFHLVKLIMVASSIISIYFFISIIIYLAFTILSSKELE